MKRTMELRHEEGHALHMVIKGRHDQLISIGRRIHRVVDFSRLQVVDFNRLRLNVPMQWTKHRGGRFAAAPVVNKIAMLSLNLLHQQLATC